MSGGSPLARAVTTSGLRSSPEARAASSGAGIEVEEADARIVLVDYSNQKIIKEGARPTGLLHLNCLRNIRKRIVSRTRPLSPESHP